MSRGMPSMTALLGMLAIAGYQNRDKLADMFRNANTFPPDEARPAKSRWRR
ncbi:hypothetical protein ACVIW3_003397 [Bradyrhizobium diazoefficiens]